MSVKDRLKSIVGGIIIKYNNKTGAVFMDKKEIYLFIAILLPIIMILIVAISLLFPVKKLSPKYNFLYVIGDNAEPYTCLQNMAQKFYPKRTSSYDFYKIDPEKCKKLQLFVYDFKTDSIKPITFADAKKLRIAENLPTDAGNFYISRYCYRVSEKSFGKKHQKAFLKSFYSS
jgi:hypothetical protein